MIHFRKEEFIGFFILKNNYFQFKAGTVLEAKFVYLENEPIWIDFIVKNNSFGLTFRLKTEPQSFGLTFRLKTEPQSFKKFQQYIEHISEDEVIIKDIIQ